MTIGIPRTLAAATAAAAFAFAAPVGAIPITLDLNNGSILAGDFYTSPTMFFDAVVVQPGGGFFVDIDFLGSQRLSLTDSGSEIIEEQISIVSFRHTPDFPDVAGQKVDIGNLVVDITGILDTTPPLDQPNPDAPEDCLRELINFCFAQNFGDLTDGTLSFKDLHLVFFLDPAIGQAVTFNAVRFQVSANTIKIEVPEPGTLALFAAGLAGLGLFRRHMRRA
jgi:hypothetical protein